MEKKTNKILKLASTILILTTGLGVATTVNSSTNYLVSHESHNRVGCLLYTSDAADED